MTSATVSLMQAINFDFDFLRWGGSWEIEDGVPIDHGGQANGVRAIYHVFPSRLLSKDAPFGWEMGYGGNAKKLRR